MEMTSAAANSALRQLAAHEKADAEWYCVYEEKSLLLLRSCSEIEKLKAANAPLNFITT
jgi:hypothetical protein